MQLFDPNNPNEKKKMIAAGVLGVAAIALLLVTAGAASIPSWRAASIDPIRVLRDE